MLKYLTVLITLSSYFLTRACNNDTIWEEALRQCYAKKENFCLKQTLNEINNASKQFIFLTSDQAKLRSLLSKKVRENPGFSKLLPCTICFNVGKEVFYQGEPSLRTHLFNKHGDTLEGRQEALKQARLIAATVYNAQTLHLMKY